MLDPTPLARRAVLALLLACSLLAGACSNVKLAYNNADTLIMFWADRYVDFDSAQRDMVKPRLQNLLAWHRATQLREYTGLLARIDTRLAQGNVAATEVGAIEADVQERIRRVTERALPDLADLALALRPEQIERIDRKMAENIEKYQQESLPSGDETRTHKRAQRSIERAEDWLGRLARGQREQIRAAAEKNLAAHELVIQERQQRRADLVALLRSIQRERPARTVVIARLQAYSDTLMARGNNERELRHRSVNLANATLTATIVNLATSEQRANASAKLREWAVDFNTLANRAAESSTVASGS